MRYGEHHSVMLSEVLDVLRPAGEKRIVDCTFGRGGHTVGFLERGCSVLAMDRDQEAIDAAIELKKKWGDKLEVVKGDFRDLSRWVEGEVDGVLMDLGVSSPQFDVGERGFSLRQEGPLDMRMDRESSETAEKILNERSEEDLEMILREYGEERGSRRIARAIVRERESKPLRTTTQLADLVSRVMGGRRGAKIHPATRVFQALRIAVNDELNALSDALEGMRKVLKAGGRFAVISFHSLEDRIVKRFIERCSMEELRGEGMAFGHPNPDYFLKKLGNWKATEEEIAVNPRARSARLRAAERIVNVA